MISNYSQYMLDPQTGEHYVRPLGLANLFDDVWFKIPKDKLMLIYKFLRNHKNNLYTRLKQIDQDFYVLVEQVPGRGFERVIPTNPTYHPDRVTELRNITLQEIENTVHTAVRLHYYIDPHSLEVTGFLGYPTLIDGTAYLPLELKPKLQETSHFKSMNFGAFFVALEETVLPL